VGQGILIHEVSRSHTTTHHSRQDSSAQAITSMQTPQNENTQHSQQTSMPPVGLSCVPATSVHARFPPIHLSGKTHVSKWGCPASKRACSERACKTDDLVGSGEQACLSAASWSLVWAAAKRSPAVIIGKTRCNNQQFSSG